MNSLNETQWHFTIEDKAHSELLLLTYVQRERI